MYRKAGEGSRVELVSELVASASGLVECGLVYVMEGFQEEEGVSLCVFNNFFIETLVSQQTPRAFKYPIDLLIH